MSENIYEKHTFKCTKEGCNTELVTYMWSKYIDNTTTYCAECGAIMKEEPKEHKHNFGIIIH